MIGYVVESGVTDAAGVRVGTARIWVGTRVRAALLAAEKPGATFRAVPYDEMPQRARDNLERAAAER